MKRTVTNNITHSAPILILNIRIFKINIGAECVILSGMFLFMNIKLRLSDI